MEIYLLLTKVSSKVIPDENFSQNLSYNFSEFLYNFISFSLFLHELELFKLRIYGTEGVNATGTELLDRL